MPSWLLVLSGEPEPSQVLTSDLGGRGTNEPGYQVTELLTAPAATVKGQRKKEGGSALSKACPQAPEAFTLGAKKFSREMKALCVCGLQCQDQNIH